MTEDVYDLMAFSDADCRAIWSKIVRQPYDWPMKSKTKARLAGLLGESASSSRLQHLCQPGSAKALREAVGPLLLSDSMTLREATAKWIISDWGGIRRGDAAIAEWLVSLGDFEHSRVEKFLEDIGTKRIASWSKLLSFHNPHTYAIYDARTAFSLNAALYLMGRQPVFFPPTGRNGTVESSVRAIRSHVTGTAGYNSYLSLLSCFVGLGLAENILQAEEIVFAAAPAMAFLIQAMPSAQVLPTSGVLGEIGVRDLQTTSHLNEHTFHGLEAAQKDIILELIPDVLGGENSTTPSAVKRGLEKIAKAADVELTPAMRASMIAYVKSGSK